jgi:hypothetical protein
MQKYSELGYNRGRSVSGALFNVIGYLWGKKSVSRVCHYGLVSTG